MRLERRCLGQERYAKEGLNSPQSLFSSFHGTGMEFRKHLSWQKYSEWAGKINGQNHDVDRQLEVVEGTRHRRHWTVDSN